MFQGLPVEISRYSSSKIFIWVSAKTDSAKCDSAKWQDTYITEKMVQWGPIGNSTNNYSSLIILFIALIQNSLACVITLQNINTSHQHSKNYTGFLSNKESITNSVFTHTKHKSTTYCTYLYNKLVFHFHHILFLQDLLIHLFFPFTWQKGFLCHRSTTLEFTPDTWNASFFYQYYVPNSEHTSSKLCSLPNLFPISFECLPGFWFLLFSFYALEWHLVLDTGL